MALKRVVDSLDGISEEHQKLYTKGEDGKFRLDVEDEDTAGLKSALQKERDRARDFESKWKKLAEFEGLDPKFVKEIVARFDGDEDAKLIRDGKIDEVFERRTEKMRRAFEKQLKEKDDAIEAEKQKASRWTQRALDSSLREAASKVGLHPTAIEDAVFRGRTMFTVDDEGNAVQVRDGSVVMGKNGKTPFGPQEWLESMRESAPHWFPASGSGSGSPPGGSKGGGRGGKTMKRADFDRLPPADRAATVKEGVAIVD